MKLFTWKFIQKSIVWTKIYIYNCIVQFRILTLLSFMVLLYHYNAVEVRNINLNNGLYFSIFCEYARKVKFEIDKGTIRSRDSKRTRQWPKEKYYKNDTEYCTKNQNWSNANPENSVPCRVSSSCSTSAKLCWTKLISCYDNKYNKWEKNTIQSNIKYQNRRKGHNRYHYYTNT